MPLYLIEHMEEIEADNEHEAQEIYFAHWANFEWPLSHLRIEVIRDDDSEV